MRNLIYILIVSFFHASCSDMQNEGDEPKNEQIENEDQVKMHIEGDTDLPEADSLKNFPGTDFNLTFDGKIINGKNIIYTPVMPYCWDEIRAFQKDKIVLDKNINALHELHNTKFHLEALKKGDYKTSFEYDKENLRLTVKASFAKSLPFSTPFILYPDKELYQNDSVYYFGCPGTYHDMVDNVSILYFDDKEFAVALHPMDKNNLILLYSPDKITNKPLSEIYTEFRKKSEEFKMDKSIEYWKKHFNEDDLLMVPVIRFNLIKRHTDLIKNIFWVNDTLHTIVEATERIGFILNESGAVIESEGEMAEEAAAEEPEQEEEKPKIMVFNRPFYVFLIRTDKETAFPYFAALIRNSELLIK